MAKLHITKITHYKETMLEKIFNALRDEWRDKLTELDRFDHTFTIEIIADDNIYEFEFSSSEKGSYGEETYSLIIDNYKIGGVDTKTTKAKTPELTDYFVDFSKRAVAFLLNEIKEMEK